MRRWHLGLMAVMMCACSEPMNSGSSEGTDDPEQSGNTPVVQERTCEEMSCSHGCCDGKCVDLSSDPAHCGRCHVACSGSYCLDGQCVMDCEGATAKVCEGSCIDVSKHSQHCGRCGDACGPNMVCSNGECVCAPTHSDCDGNAANGCESPVPMCMCTGDEVFECYEYFLGGEPGVGICKSGFMRCVDGMFGVCEGYVGPSLEVPGNGVDENCNGIVDELIDEDGDGYYYGAGPDGDCCDSRAHCNVENPALVNPGATETPGNGIDDDCDGMIDEDETVLCSTQNHKFTAGKKLEPSDAVLLARAMDICTDAGDNTGGLISAELLLADGSPLPAAGNKSVCGNRTLISPAEQVAVMTDLGGIVHALNGTMAVLSSGKAQGRENTGRMDCSGTEVDAPAAFLAAHGGALPVSTACTGVAASSHRKANDSIMLRLKLRAPSNAKGFKYRFKFFSKEYPKYVCNSYNDFFLAQTDASSSEIPADRNISFDAKNNPVSVNNAFFTECDREACLKLNAGNPGVCTECSGGKENIRAYVDNVATAGATEWLQTSVPVTPDEEFTLDLIIFDAGDRGEKQNGWGHIQDSLVLIDKFEWTTEATTLRTEVN